MLRPMRSSEVDALVRITAETGFFRAEEVEVAREVLTDCARKGAASGYTTIVAREDSLAAGVALDDGSPLGYVCYGPTPGTRGTWDIYWIAVDKGSQGHGIGRKLMATAEENMGRQSGRMAVVETSSLAMYDLTRRFYLGQGYREAARIEDFYDIGDAKVLYTKGLTPGGPLPMHP